MKYKIKIAQYKNSKSIFGHFIRFQQAILQGLPNNNAKFSHSEIVFCANDDEDVLERLRKIEKVYLGNERIFDTWEGIFVNRGELFEISNLWFSSSEVDKGTRFKFISDNKNNWEYKELEVTKKEYLKMLDYCIENDNNSYGWLSIIFTQGLKTLWFIKRENPFCSQIVLQALQSIGLYAGENAIEYNPGKLSVLITNLKKDYASKI